ncbi:MAG: sulfite exporter TauE/SafE family protein [Deltaproteobacteria bacterium]|nr:MAG: sulfite exporter TauE/SafE family protein [Deltaproteobacteria bacterium]
MEYIIICLAALITAALTLFSGFGLGTLFLPVFALFFPLEVAIALTAIVHLLNNLLKFIMLGRHADLGVLWRFGLPAIVAAGFGAQTLVWLSDLKPWLEYHLGSRYYQVMPVKVVVALLMIGFAMVELAPKFKHLAFEKRWLPLGGLLSGFFGGLSGHQGALRSAFLIRSGLTPQSFIATGVVIACLVDLARLSVYGTHMAGALTAGNLSVLVAATLSAFLGTFLGNRLLKKVTLAMMQILVAVMLLLIAAGLGTGLI